MDSLLLRRLIAEISDALCGIRIDQIYAMPRDHVAIVLGQQRAPRLWFSSEPQHPHLYVRRGAHPAPKRPPAFAMAARKLLSGRRVAAIECLENDRVVELRCSGDTAARVVFELVPRRATAMLIDPENRVHSVWHPRRGRPEVGETYALPERGSRRPLESLGTDDWNMLAAAPDTEGLARGLLRTVSGMSLLIAREAAHRYSVGTRLDEATAIELQRAEQEPTAAVVYSPVPLEDLEELPGASRLLLAPYPLDHAEGPQAGLHATRFDSLTEAAALYYPLRAELRALGEARQKLETAAGVQMARLQRTLDAVSADADSLEDPDDYRRRGDLLLAHPHAPRRGDTATLPDDYGDGSPIEILVDPQTTLVDNAQGYYRKARRAERSRKHTAARRAKLERQIDELGKVRTGAEGLGSLPGADKLAGRARRLGARLKPERWHTPEARVDIEDTPDVLGDEVVEEKQGQGRRGTRLPEGAGGGYSRKTERPATVGFPSTKHPLPATLPPAKRPAPGILAFTAADGSEILVGRNAAANERLTHKLAAPHDFWLHAEGPGSHVVIRNPNRAPVPNNESLRQAAALAAHFSFARGSTKVNVRWTQVRHLRKPKGGPKGQVILKKAQTVLAEPVAPEDLFEE